jgi:hypothetical protein
MSDPFMQFNSHYRCYSKSFRHNLRILQ